MRPPVAAALYLAQETLSALEHLHDAADSKGVPIEAIHGDLSPANVLVSFKGDVKLIDFGVADSRLLREEVDRVTVRGKPGYISPEHIAFNSLDARSDLFALGVVIAEVAIGRRLFRGDGEIDLILRNLEADATPLWDDGLPEAVIRVLCRAIARDPDERYQTAGEFRAAIDSAARQLAVPVNAGALHQHLAALHLGPASSGVYASVPTPTISQGSCRSPAIGGEKEEPERPSLASAASSEASRTRAPGSILVAPGGVDADPARRHRVRVHRRGEKSQTMDVSLARLAEMVAVGAIRSGDSVAIDDEAPRRVCEHPLLRALSERAPRSALPSSRLAWRRAVDRGELPGFLFRLLERGPTGLLVARDRTVERRVYLDRGRPVWGASTERSELLGAQLRAAGWARPRAVSLSAAYALRAGRPLGEALVRFGGVPAVAVVRQLITQCRERFLRIGCFASGDFAFYSVPMDRPAPSLLDGDPASWVFSMMLEHYTEQEAGEWLKRVGQVELARPTPTRKMFDDMRALLGLVEDGDSIDALVRRARQAGVVRDGCLLRLIHLALEGGLVRVARRGPGARGK